MILTKIYLLIGKIMMMILFILVISKLKIFQILFNLLYIKILRKKSQ